ncbi:MAG: bifunctional 3'-5' exonuclease/DNA polymerase [Hydrogenothermaceae bacterium]|nr:bifunctional 3'-5' exonuclease/DNA polymerase [Hydrogenothermaceae bacterium]
MTKYLFDSDSLPPQLTDRDDLKYITDFSGLEKVSRVLEKQKFIYFDCEVASENFENINPFKDKIRLIQLGNEEKVFIVDVQKINDRGKVSEFLADLLRERGIVGHNLKFDIKFLYTNFGVLPKLNFDTMIASQIISEGNEGDRHSLKAVTSRFTGKDVDKRLQKSDWGSEHLTNQQLEYAAEDIRVLRDVFKVVRDILNKDGEESLSGKIGSVFGLKNPVAILEMTLIPILAEIELSGIPVDLNLLNSTLEDKKSEFQLLYFDFRKRFSVDPFSPNQITNCLVNRLKIELPKTEKGSYSSQDTFLRNFLDYEEVRLLLTIRTLKRSLDKLLEILSYISNGRVFGEFKQIGAPTGRMTSLRPNLQNIPSSLKEIFKAEEGRVFIVADYSQIELRLAAEYTKDERMIKAFVEGRDLHRVTASIIIGKRYEDITPEERRLAKAINFGLIYGMSPKFLVEYSKANYDIEISLDEAKQFHMDFFDYYKSFRRWHNAVKEKLKKHRVLEVKTLFGRKILASRFTDAVNYPIQGSGSDLLKMAVVFFSKMKDSSSKIVNLVHDEILVESEKTKIKENASIVGKAMEKAGKFILKTVPVSFEISINDRWKKG